MRSMIVLPGDGTPVCDGMTRREWLRAGGLSTLSLMLPDLLRADSSKSNGRAKSCIVVFLFGAPAHQDVWDLKPDAPKEVRGEFKPIASKVPGILVGEHIPHIARQTHHLSLIRSVSHP